MDNAQLQRVINHPDFQAMAQKKSKLGTMFSILTLFIYFSYILLIAFNKPLFAIPISAGATTTVGVILGIFIIVFCVVITGIYVSKANGEFDTLTKKVVDDINNGKI